MDADREAWRVETSRIEAVFQQDLNNRDANLADREAEHKRERDSIAAMHAALVKKNKDEADAAIAALNKALRDAELRHNAAILALRDEMSKLK